MLPKKQFEFRQKIHSLSFGELTVRQFSEKQDCRCRSTTHLQQSYNEMEHYYRTYVVAQCISLKLRCLEKCTTIQEVGQKVFYIGSHEGGIKIKYIPTKINFFVITKFLLYIIIIMQISRLAQFALNPLLMKSSGDPAKRYTHSYIYTSIKIVMTSDDKVGFNSSHQL